MVVAVVFRFTKKGGIKFGHIFARNGSMKDLLKKIGDGERLRSASTLKKDLDDPKFYTTTGGILLDGVDEIEEAVSEGNVVLLTYASQTCYISPIKED
ncbi:MAG: hypothetical protein WC536_00825 [Patescibacteria group bacterium]